MASPFLWPVLVPSALRAPAPINLGVMPHDLQMVLRPDTRVLVCGKWANNE